MWNDLNINEEIDDGECFADNTFNVKGGVRLTGLISNESDENQFFVCVNKETGQLASQKEQCVVPPSPPPNPTEIIVHWGTNYCNVSDPNIDVCVNSDITVTSLANPPDDTAAVYVAGFENDAASGNYITYKWGNTGSDYLGGKFLSKTATAAWYCQNKKYDGQAGEYVSYGSTGTTDRTSVAGIRASNNYARRPGSGAQWYYFKGITCKYPLAGGDNDWAIDSDYIYTTKEVVINDNSPHSGNDLYVKGNAEITAGLTVSGGETNLMNTNIGPNSKLKFSSAPTKYPGNNCNQLCTDNEGYVGCWNLTTTSCETN